ncbi:hypothetical protein Hypma_001196 [Hypsizygus marmoreus]|uniref:Uncharacterized protein n=1 Tax=Hypsizygus marmoreus TaxID=39966 RepID=A0A369JAP0_HYPMA|nr:hypothetical protein Hypma_001196 [Hypsizygus marmoreus]
MSRQILFDSILDRPRPSYPLSSCKCSPPRLVIGPRAVYALVHQGLRALVGTKTLQGVQPIIVDTPKRPILELPTCRFGTYNGTYQSAPPLPTCPPFSEPLPDPFFAVGPSFVAVATPIDFTVAPIFPDNFFGVGPSFGGVTTPIDFTPTPILPFSADADLANEHGLVSPLNNYGFVGAVIVSSLVINFIVRQLLNRRGQLAAIVEPIVITKEKDQGEFFVKELPTTALVEVLMDLPVPAPAIDPAYVPLPPVDVDEFEALARSVEGEEDVPTSIPLSTTNTDDVKLEATVDDYEDVDPAFIPLPIGDDDELDFEVYASSVKVIDPAYIPLPAAEEGELDIKVEVMDAVVEDPDITLVEESPSEMKVADHAKNEAVPHVVEKIIQERAMEQERPLLAPVAEVKIIRADVAQQVAVPESAIPPDPTNADIIKALAVLSLAIHYADAQDIPSPVQVQEELDVDRGPLLAATVVTVAEDVEAAQEHNGPPIHVVPAKELRYIWRRTRPCFRNTIDPHLTRLPPIPDEGEGPFRRRQRLTFMPTIVEVEEVEEEMKGNCGHRPLRIPPPEKRSRTVAGSRRDHVYRPRKGPKRPAPRT